MIINKEDINNLEQRHRATFINSLAGFRQAVLVGTTSKNKISNVAIFNSLIHLGANPALFGLISRPDSVNRDTLQNILDTKQYTLNYVDSTLVEKAHQTSARYETSEFAAVGFTEQYKKNIQAPFVAEAIVKIGLQLQETIPIKLNGTILIIGSLEYIEIEDSMVGQDGFVDLAVADTLISCGLDAYFTTQKVGRYSYAKPDAWPKKID
jgi:flavin reductase (DIM6/NTAB) family NADH-FMN oxidoreductase RutF